LRYRHDFETFYHLGNAFKHKGNLPDAIDAYRHAIKLNSRFAEAYSNLGATLRQQGSFADAIAAYRQAIALDPNMVEAHYNLGIALEEQGKPSAAIEAYHRALALKPDFIEAYENLGVALQSEGRLAEAITAYRKVLAWKPDAQIYNILGTALFEQGKYEEANRAYRDALILNPGYAESHSNLLLGLNYRADIEPGDLFTQHVRWATQHASAIESTCELLRNDRMPDRVVRVGYVSPDFRAHSVAFFIEPVLDHHDRDKFTVYCYSNVARPDAVTDRLRGHSDHWREIARRDDHEVATQIHEDRIDILVDLAGHTGRNRLLVFARKPVPIQVTYLGYPNTTGLMTIDYRLTDAIADPIGSSDASYSETLVRLPKGFLCYRPPERCPPITALPALNTGYVTFGCFNNVSKVNPAVVAIWARILQALPRARLLLKGAAFADTASRDRVQALFGQDGITADRIEMTPLIKGRAEHLQTYGRVDIALDPFPYNGTTTTCEALWMGVPVISLAGQTHAGRVGVSLLTHVGLSELIAESPEAYVQLAVELASNLEHLQYLRRGLRERLQRSPLMDAAGFTRSLEQAYREMWKRYCEN
jgi:predicted O-linked N-acetylglucosamine transferase (SPINDLY family)